MEDQANLLKQITKGAGIMFFSVFVLYIIEFLSKLIVSRYLGPADYGLIALGYAVLNVGIVFSLLGLNEGISRYLPHFLERNEPNKIKGTILAAIKISLLISLIICSILIIFSKEISIGIFHSEKFIPILIVFSLTIPFFVLIMLFNSFVLSFKKPEYNLWGYTLGKHFINLILVIIFIYLGASILQISLIYLFTTILSVILFLFFIQKKIFPFLISKLPAEYDYKSLFKFSWPLFLSGFFSIVFGWMDTIFLGFLKTNYEVGVYNIALPLAAAQCMFLTMFSRIFYPIMVQLHTRKDYEGISKLYSIVLRWIFAFSFPFFLLLILFPKRILSLLYGSEYVVGSTVLVILAIAYFIETMMGPTAEALMTFNKTRFIMLLNIATSILNITLSLLLIPFYGIEGAAFSTGISLIFRKIIMIIKLRNKINFFNEFKYIVKYFSAGIFSISLVYLVLNMIGSYGIILLLSSFVFFILIYFILLLFLKAFSKEDLMIMNAIEKKLGLNLNLLKKFMGKFV